MLSVQNASYSSEISAARKREDDNTCDLPSLCEGSDLQPTVTSNHRGELLQFSVRDYVCSARKKDIRQNWPFPHHYLQVCLDHEVKEILPPFEPRQSFKPWYADNCEEIRPLYGAYGLKATASTESQLHDRSYVDEPSSAVCIVRHQVGDNHNDQEGVRRCCTSSKKPSASSSSEVEAAHHPAEGVDNDLLVISIDNLVRERLLVPAIKCATSSATARNSSKLLLPKSQVFRKQDGGDLRPPVRSDDKSSVTGSEKEEDVLAETKPESGRSVGISSSVSALVDPMASKVCPVCGEFSSNSNTTLNAHIDQCLASTAELVPGGICHRKYKVKARKIRTMEDIYATARRRTLKELDQTNGTTWAPNAALVPAGDDDIRESKRPRPPDMNTNCVDGSASNAVYIDVNGTKLRILSQLNEDCTVSPRLRKSSKSDATESIPVSCTNKSLVSGSCKLSRSKSQSKKLGMLKLHENKHKQNHKPTRGTHERKKKRVSLHKEALERTLFSATLKQWVGSKRTGLSRKTVVHDGQLGLAEDNVVQDVALSAGNGYNSCSPGSMDDTIVSPRKQTDMGEIDKSIEHSHLVIRKNILCLGKKSMGKTSNIPKRTTRCKAVREMLPADCEKGTPSVANAGKQIEEEYDGPRVPTHSSSQTVNCNLGCSKDSFEAETSMFIDYEDVSKNSDLDSVESSDVNSPMQEEIMAAPKLQSDCRFLEGVKANADFHAGDAPSDPRPQSREIALSVENSLSSLHIYPGDPTHFSGAAPAKLLPSGERSLHMEPGVAARAELTIPGSCGKNSCFNSQISNEVVLRTQPANHKIDDKHGHLIENVLASASQISSTGSQGEGISISPARGRTVSDSFWETPALRCNHPSVPGCSNLIGSQHLNSSSIYTHTETSPLCKTFQPGAFSCHCMTPDKSNLRTSSHHFESIENSSPHFLQVYQPTPPHYITGDKGEGCKASAVCSNQQVLAHINMPAGAFPYGCICSKSKPFEGSISSGSDLNTNFTCSWRPAVSGNMFSSTVFSPRGFVFKQMQRDTVRTSDPTCSFTPSMGSEFCRSLPATNSVLRLMGKNLMVANNNDAQSTLLARTAHEETKDHPDSDHPALVAYPGPNVSMLEQFPSNHNARDACSIYSNSCGELPVGWSDDIHGGVTPSRSCLQTRFNSKTEAQLQYKKLIQGSGTSGPLDVEWRGIDQSEEAVPICGLEYAKEIIIIDDSPESCKTNPKWVDTAYCNFGRTKSPLNTVLYQPLSHKVCKPAEALPSLSSARHHLPYAEPSTGQFSFFTLPPGGHVNYDSVVRPGKS